MKFLPLTALSLVCVLALTACNKPQEPAPAEPAKTETQTPTLNLDGSPTLEVMTHALKVGAWGIIQGTTPNLSLSDEQIACLVDYDKTSFGESAKTQAQKILDAELLKASDEFYNTETGQKLLALTKQVKLDKKGDLVADEQAVELTADDQAKVAEFSESVMGKKLNDATASDIEAMQTLMVELANKEKTRCQIAN